MALTPAATRSIAGKQQNWLHVAAAVDRRDRGRTVTRPLVRLLLHIMRPASVKAGSPAVSSCDYIPPAFRKPLRPGRLIRISQHDPRPDAAKTYSPWNVDGRLSRFDNTSVAD